MCCLPLFTLSLPYTDPWSSDSDLSDLSPVEDEYAKVDKTKREPPDIGDVTVTAVDDVTPPVSNVTSATVTPQPPLTVEEQSPPVPAKTAVVVPAAVSPPQAQIMRAETM